MNRIILSVIGVLVFFNILLYGLYKSTKQDLADTKVQLETSKRENKQLQEEITRRNENAKKLEQRMSKLRAEFDRNYDWANTLVPVDVANGLRK